MSNAAIMVYNEEDALVKKVVEETDVHMKKYPYTVLPHFIETDQRF